MFPKPKHKRRVPKQKQRNAITTPEYQKAVDYFGECCYICGLRPIEMHHIHHRSQGGRGTYRNLMPLCKKHHDKAHEERDFANYLRELKVEVFGIHYYKDRYDLHDEGLIDEPTEQEYEKFMKSEELK